MSGCEYSDGTEDDDALLIIRAMEEIERVRGRLLSRAHGVSTCVSTPNLHLAVDLHQNEAELPQIKGLRKSTTRVRMLKGDSLLRGDVHNSIESDLELLAPMSTEDCTSEEQEGEGEDEEDEEEEGKRED